MGDKYSDKWGTDLAMIFKSLKSPERLGAVTGEVVSIAPLSVKVTGDEIIINSSIHDVYVSSHLLGTYKRDMEGEGKIRFSDAFCGVTDLAGACETAGDHKHEVQTLDINTKYKFSGEITHTDDIEVGDFVLVLPDEAEQAFFIVSKLEKVGG